MKFKFENSFKKFVGFDDTWLIILGIPFVALLVNTLLFGQLLQVNSTSAFTYCMFIGLVYTSVYWFGFREIFKFIGTKYKGITQNKKRQLITALFVIVGYFFLQFILDIILHNVLINMTEIKQPSSLLKIITSMIFTVLILVIYESIYLSNQIREIEKEKSQIIKENISSQLASLKDQINPHFLFNSLNTLSSLVHEDANRADAFVQKLANVYRYILENNTNQIVSLKHELSYLHSYIHLMKERFGENLVYVEKIDAAFLDKYIIPLSLQITFENCVKHNIISKEKPLHITIEGNGNYLYITNNLQKINFPNDKASVGLENIKQRFHFFTDMQVKVEENTNEFIVGIPLLNNDSLKNAKL